MAERKLRLVRGDTIQVPSVRTFTNWTVSKIRAAERAADSGNLYQAASLCEWCLTDDRVVSGLNWRSEALLGLNPSFIESGDRRRSKRAIRALEADDDWWWAYQESELSQLIQWGVLLGVSPAQQPWAEREDTGRVLPMLEFWHPQGLRYDYQRATWVLRDASGIDFDLTPGDGRWVLHTPGGRNRPWARGIWRSVGLWVLAKQLARQDWASHGEQNATLVIEAPEKATKQARQELAQELHNRGADSVLALPNGYTAKLLEVSANTQQIYQAQIDMANDAITILCRGGNLTTKVDGGSLAATRQQAESNETPKLRYDAQALATTLYTQSLRWWAEFNFGDSRLAPWPQWPVEPAENTQVTAETIKTLGEGLLGLQTLGAVINLDAAAERFGLSDIIDLQATRKRAELADEAAANAAASVDEQSGESDDDDGEELPSDAEK